MSENVFFSKSSADSTVEFVIAEKKKQNFSCFDMFERAMNGFLKLIELPHEVSVHQYFQIVLSKDSANPSNSVTISSCSSHFLKVTDFTEPWFLSHTSATWRRVFFSHKLTFWLTVLQLHFFLFCLEGNHKPTSSVLTKIRISNITK